MKKISEAVKIVSVELRLLVYLGSQIRLFCVIYVTENGLDPLAVIKKTPFVTSVTKGLDVFLVFL